MSEALVEAWRTGEYSEDEIVEAFACEYKDFRLALTKHDIPAPETIPHKLQLEIYREYSVGNEWYDSVSWIANTYSISMASAVRFRQEKPQQLISTGHTLKDIERYAEAGFDQISIANALGCSANQVRRALGVKRQTVTADIKLAILDDLAAGYQQKVIALKYGVSESTVSYLNPNKIKKGRCKGLSDHKWQSLKAEMRMYSVSELSRLYNVSRAYIYARLKKDNCTNYLA